MPVAVRPGQRHAEGGPQRVASYVGRRDPGGRPAVAPASHRAAPRPAAAPAAAAAGHRRCTGPTGGDPPRLARTVAPRPPTTTASAAEAAATPRATGTSPAVEGTEAVAPKAKTRKSAPGGCQAWRSESVEPSAATPAASGTASQARCGEVATTVPSPTASTRSVASVSCMRRRSAPPRSRA